jgi:uncharacterized membrane protein
MGFKLNILLILLLAYQITPAYAVTTPQDITIDVQSDGVTRLDYLFQSEVTSLQTNITLLGMSYSDLFIINEDSLPLEYSESDDGLMIYSLGSSLINLTYVTSDLTSKNGAIWSISVEAPISLTIELPQGATIVSLNLIPLEIDSSRGNTVLIMPSGFVEIQYIIDLVGSETLAQQAIDEAETSIQNAINDDAIVTDTQTLLDEAKSLFQQGNYLEAEEKAADALQLLAETLQEKIIAEAKITAAETAVEAARESDKTIGLDEALKVLGDAQFEYLTGNYELAQVYADQALQTALSTEKPRDYTLFIAAGAIIVVAVGVYYLYQRKPSQEYTPTEIEIDLERLFKEHPELRMDDREVLKYLAENDGEAFAYDIRERFDIPRTSAWRMIQRLQRFEVVDERKIGGQSLIRIKEEYWRKP